MRFEVLGGIDLVFFGWPILLLVTEIREDFGFDKHPQVHENHDMEQEVDFLLAE